MTTMLMLLEMTKTADAVRAFFVLYFLPGVIMLFDLLGIVIVTTEVFTIFINCYTC
jgi:hypothetical protein